MAGSHALLGPLHEPASAHEHEDRCLRECILPWWIRISPGAADLRDIFKDRDWRPRKPGEKVLVGDFQSRLWKWLASALILKMAHQTAKHT
ncbi:hypothetical protein CTATCC11996_14523 [Comamonas testosteroni ATCC 11996]|nr:hypothetical protein CTATCC11996_14523 [Comamonas testosteroni ATCC 11996]